MPYVTLESTRNSLVSSTPGPYGSGVIFQAIPLGGYTVQARYPGYQTGTQDVNLEYSGETQTVVIILRQVGDKGPSLPTFDHSIIPPKAQKEVQKALKEIKSKENYKAARKHLERALHAAPDNYVVNYLLGMTYFWSHDVRQAKPLLQKSVLLNSQYVPALISLGAVYLDERDYPGAIQATSSATRLDPSSWRAQWILADAYLRSRSFEEARKHAEVAVKLGRGKSLGAQIILGEALTALGKRKDAATVLNSYLRQNPNAPNAASIRMFIANLQKPSRPPEAPAGAHTPIHKVDAEPETMRSAPPPVPFSVPAEAEPPKVAWVASDVDTENLQLEPGVSCSLPAVLKRVGQRTKQLARDLQEFTALEEYQAVETGRNGLWGDPISAKFHYLVFLRRESARMFDVQEVREPLGNETGAFGDLIDDGAPALVFIFHPFYQRDFKMTCDGLGAWNKQPAWLVHFVQLPDKPRVIRGFEYRGIDHPLSLKGRAWISAQSYQILHLETDLAKPVPAIELKREHTDIDYHPVKFKAHNVVLWLPENVDIYLDFKGRYYHHYHHFTHYKLFWTSASEKISSPKEKGKIN